MQTNNGLRKILSIVIKIIVDTIDLRLFVFFVKNAPDVFAF